VGGLVGSGSRGSGQIFVKASLLASSHERVDWGRSLAGLLGEPSHVGEAVVVGSWCVVCPPVSVACAKTKFGGHELCVGAGRFRGVCARSGGLEGGQVFPAIVEGVVGGSVGAIAVVLGRGQVAGPWAGVILEFSVSDAEHPSWVLLLGGPEVMCGLAHQPGQAVAGSGAVVHGSNGGPGPGGSEAPYVLVFWVLHSGSHLDGF